MLYLDSSALVKNYLAEAGSAAVTAATAAAAGVASSIVAYAEARASFARALREGRIDVARHAMAVRLLDTDWTQYAVVVADVARMREAARLMDQHPRHALRAFDAIHLASALLLVAGQQASVTFACWDQRLWRAAHDEGFTMLPPTEPV
jgi:predicted nucleic acid-binding protein